MPKTPKPRQVSCPKCGRKQNYRTPDSLYRCDKCGGMFDDSPEEGGDYSDRNPAARLEREERQQQQRKRF